MATTKRYWQNTTSTWQASAFNTVLDGSGASGLPVGTAGPDSVFFLNGSTSLTTGQNATLLTAAANGALSLWVASAAFKGDIGSSGAALDADITELRYGMPGNGHFAGIIGTAFIHLTGEQIGALTLSGSITTLYEQIGGSVAAAPTWSATLVRMFGGRLDVASGALITTAEISKNALLITGETPTSITVASGGRLRLSPTTVTAAGAPTVTIENGGILEVTGASDIPSIVLKAGGLLDVSGALDDITIGATLGRYEEGATIDARTTGVQITFDSTNASSSGGGPLVNANSNSVVDFFKS